MAGLELYLIRHGLAAERGPEYPDDSQRPLTDRGKRSIRQEARALNTLEIAFDLIVASPLTRTRQTADLLAATLKARPPVTTSEALAPSGSAAAVIDEILAHPAHACVALVGHEPNIGELAARLIGARAPIEFKKGAICRIDFDGSPPKARGQLRWFLPPRVLRKIA